MYLITLTLFNLSDIIPDDAENRINGSTNKAAEMLINISGDFKLEYAIMSNNIFLYKLSLNALSICVTE